MVLRMRRWRSGVLTGTVAPRGALVLHYRRGRRSAHVWRAADDSSAWVVSLTGSGPTVLTAHRWHAARRLARWHVRSKRTAW
jgi:homoserine kinase